MPASIPSSGSAPVPAGDAERDQAWAELRRLLVGPEREQIGELRSRIEDDSERAGAVARVLPSAVDASLERGPELRRSMQPMVRDVIELTLKHDPALVIDTVLPFFGTLIRRYITNALQDFMDAVNQAQERSVSTRSIAWRVEAWRTGKPYAEIVLAKSLLYRIEQIFLIHRQTGLKLQHRVARGVETKDADMVSGMLTAIEDFIHDSFSTAIGEKQSDTIQVGDLRVWVQHGRHALLAAVVRGAPPLELKERLAQVVEDVERKFEDRLNPYAGDPSVFAPTAPELDSCLLGRGDVETGGSSRNWKIAGGLAASALLAAAVLWWWDGARWNRLLASLRNEPGVVLTEARRGWYYHEIESLRDPLANPLEGLPERAGFGANRVSVRTGPFLSLDARFVAMRELEPRRRALEDLRIAFAVDSSVVDRAEAERAAAAIRSFASSAAATGQRAIVEVLGSADSTGTATRNTVLAAMRARELVKAVSGFETAGAVLRAGSGETGAIRGVRFRASLEPRGNE